MLGTPLSPLSHTSFLKAVPKNSPQLAAATKHGLKAASYTLTLAKSVRQPRFQWVFQFGIQSANSCGGRHRRIPDQPLTMNTVCITNASFSGGDTDRVINMKQRPGRVPPQRRGCDLTLRLSPLPDSLPGAWLPSPSSATEARWLGGPRSASDISGGRCRPRGPVPPPVPAASLESPVPSRTRVVLRCTRGDRASGLDSEPPCSNRLKETCP